MIVKVENKPDQKIDFKYTGDTVDIKEDEIRANIDEIKRLTLTKLTGKEDVEHLMTKFKIRRSAGTNLLPTDLYARKNKTEILREVFEILNDPETILSLVYQPLHASHFAQGSIPGVLPAKTHMGWKKIRGAEMNI